MLTILLAAGLAFAAGAAWLYNRLVRLDNRARSAWSDIDVQLRRRHDLVGNLVETVRGYARHERETFEAVARARADAERAVDEARPAEASLAEGGVTAGMRTLFALAEAYPELKASARFLDLHTQLVAVEDDLQNARRYYNAVVRDLNTRIESFPDLIVAPLFGFSLREFFELEDAREALPPVVALEGS